MADPQEVKGSRREWEDGHFKYGMRLYVGSAVGDAPATGDYFTTAAAVVESGLTGRKCIQVNKDPEAIPGVWFFTSTYKAFKSYS